MIMPVFAETLPVKGLMVPELKLIEGDVFPMGSAALDAQYNNCKPRLVRADSFLLDPHLATVGLQKAVLGEKVANDNAPDNFPATFSVDLWENFTTRLSAMSGKRFGTVTEAEWEFACKDRIDARELMEKRGLKSIADLQAWLVEGGGNQVVENCVVLGKGEKLTTRARLLINPTDSKFQRILEQAHTISLWTCFGTASGGLSFNEAVYDTNRRSPVGQKPPNGKGLYDMSGLMWEWTGDVYAADTQRLGIENPYNAPKNAEDRSPRVRRGGSWFDGRVCLRAACRRSISLVNRRDDFEARLAASAGPKVV